MSEFTSTASATAGEKDPNIINPPIIKPTILGKESGSSAPSLGDFATEDEEDNDPGAAENREALSAFLGLMGFPDLPATKTDLVNMAGRMMKLQAQITEQIKELQASGADLAGLGSGEGAIQGPPDPAVATKIAALNDLQTQFQEAGQKLKDYAYSYFSGTEQPLTLSQAQIARAYSEGILNRDAATSKLAALGMAPNDVKIVLGLEDKAKADASAKPKKSLGADTILDGYKAGAVNANEVVSRLRQQGYSETDIRLVLKILDAEKKASKKDSGGTGSKGSSGSSGGTGAVKSASGGNINVNVKVDTAALAKEALARAQGRNK